MSETAEEKPPSPAPGEVQNPADSQGETLPRRFGKYTLLRRLATGGMAELYLALHRAMAGFEKLTVIKRILPEMSRDKGFVTMLLQEARIAATFSHPNIVTIFDVGQVEGTYFIAMEHIHGEDLRSIVRGMKPKGLREFPLEHAIAITQGVCAGLAYAHEKTDLNGNPLNIVHRDISPQNILVTFTGDVKVVDFGIAKATQGEAFDPAHTAEEKSGEISKERPAEEHKTRVGQIKGKVPYMSPEQARGEPLDARSDIFSLGVILFELATGRRLFRGPNEYETLKMITDGEYPRAAEVNPRVPASIDAVITKALEKDVSLRYQTAREMQADLEAAVREERLAVSNLSLGTWMQMLFEERLAAQREALQQGKQLADVIAAEEPDHYTAAGTSIPPYTIPPQTQKPSRTPWLFAAIGLFVAAAIGTGVVIYRDRQRDKQQREQAAAAQAEAERVNSGSINVTSDPPGASIWLNGAPTNFKTPYKLEKLPTGPNSKFTIKVAFDGYAPVTREVLLGEPNASQSLQLPLEKLQAEGLAMLEVTTSPPGATVLVDGKQVGVTGTAPLKVTDIQPHVQHTVLVQRTDMADETFTFTGKPGEVERRTLTLRERPLGPDEAWVTVVTDPVNASLRVGDRSIETRSPFRVRVLAGKPVRFAFNASGFESLSREVNANAGQTLDLGTVRLERRGSPPPHGTGSLRVGSTPWCIVKVDGRTYGETPVVIPSISAGSHTVVCTTQSHGAQTHRVSVQPGKLTMAPFRFP